MSETTVHIFERASKLALRFDTSRGQLTTEQLWELPLQTVRSNALDLDTIGKGLMKALREEGEDSLVTPKSNEKKDLLQLKLAIVKRIIEAKQEENASKTQAAANASERARLREILETKKADALGQLSVEEIEARLKALGG